MSAPARGAFARLEELLAEPWLALDTETTGTGPHDQVVEVAIVAHDGRVLFESLVCPSRPVPRTATRIHGLGPRELEAAPTWDRVWPHVRTLLVDYRLLAWNAAFDVRLLRQTCARYRLPFRLRSFLCLQEVFRWRFPRSRASLAAACLALGLDRRPAHRARIDAEIAREVALRMVEVDPVASQS